MSFLEHCRRQLVTARPGESVRTAARRMREHGVGALPIVDEQGRPVGMLTDRDIVQRCLRRHRDADETKVSEIMNPDVVSIWAEVPLVRAFHRMRQESVRRILAVDSGGRLVGIFTYDDALPMIADQFALAADVLRAQQPTQREPA